MLVFFADVQQNKITEVIGNTGFHDARKFDISVGFDQNIWSIRVDLCCWQCNKGEKTICYEEVIIFLKLCSLINL